MATVPISELKPGMKLAKDVCLNDNRLLLLSGFVMKTLYIESLRSFGIASVEIDDTTMDPVEYVSLEKVYFEAFDSIKSIMTSVREGEEIDVQLTCHTVDGTGYPYRLKGDSVNLDSRIVCITDVYDALSSDRVYKKKSLPHATVDYIPQNAGTLFDPGIVEAFISSMDIYPDNQVVVLNTGEIGSIINKGSGINEKPQIYVITRKYGPPVLNPYVVNLQENPSAEIIDMLK